MSTARRLIELGLNNFEIFEGLDRIGGRIHAIAYSEETPRIFLCDWHIKLTEDGYLQMGAQFINGAENPLYKIASRLGLISDVVSDTAHVDNARFVFGAQNVQQFVLARHTFILVIF